MKNLAKLLIILAVATLGQSAFGVTYLFQSPIGVYVDQQFWFDNPLTMNNATPTISGVLDVSAATGVEVDWWDSIGYDPLTETITAVEILFAIDSELINIQFGSEDAGGADVASVNLDGLLNGNFFIHAFNLSGSGLGGSLLLTLVNTGVLNWQLSLTSAQLETKPPISVGLIAASLAVQVEHNYVPDSGATLGLLGACMLGLVSLKRRLS